MTRHIDDTTSRGSTACYAPAGASAANRGRWRARARTSGRGGCTGPARRACTGRAAGRSSGRARTCVGKKTSMLETRPSRARQAERPRLAEARGRPAESPRTGQGWQRPILAADSGSVYPTGARTGCRCSGRRATRCGTPAARIRPRASRTRAASPGNQSPTPSRCRWRGRGVRPPGAASCKGV